MNLSIGGDLAPSLGGREKNSQTKNFFRKKSIFTAKISDDPFLVIDHDFRIFPIFHIFAACNVVFDPFFARKTPISEYNSFTTPFFTLFVLSRPSDKHYFSKYRGNGCMGHLKFFWGGPSPQNIRP